MSLVRCFTPMRSLRFMLVAVAVMLLGGCIEYSKEALEEVNRPLAKEFLLGPEDVVEVTVWRNQDLSRTVIVRPDGMISLPLVGDVQANGLTASQVAERISKRLSEYKENPSVSVSVKEVNSYFIYVVGEVFRPGKYPLKSYATVLQGVSLAGGFTPFASKNKMAVVRHVKETKSGEEKQVRIPAKYDDLMMGRGEMGNFRLQSGDTIVVP
jgi:polysaccharide biosynthesis/export protein